MKLLVKIPKYCLGLLFLAVGVTFSIKSNLGISPVNSIGYVLSVIMGIDQGKVITVIFSIYVLLQLVLLRRKFKPQYLLQIVFSTIFGYFVSFSNKMLTFPVAEFYPLQMAYLAMSIVLVAIGVTLYMGADLMPMPAEGVMIAISQLTGISFHKVKMIFDTSVVIISAAVSLVFAGRILGVREGTVLSALLVGKLVGIFNSMALTGKGRARTDVE
ncbi:YczE/YyaS/YitT family protein [Youngiibacter fragilis]|nr:DUF6198 family protein [Youngiibacter fragilis]